MLDELCSARSRGVAKLLLVREGQRDPQSMRRE
jgi:hypothetical protein